MLADGVILKLSEVFMVFGSSHCKYGYCRVLLLLKSMDQKAGRGIQIRFSYCLVIYII